MSPRGNITKFKQQIGDSNVTCALQNLISGVVFCVGYGHSNMTQKPQNSYELNGCGDSQEVKPQSTTIYKLRFFNISVEILYGRVLKGETTPY